MSQVDLHLHSTASDGRLSPAEVVAVAAGRGLTTIALTDHDTIGGIAQAAAAALLRVENHAVVGSRDDHIGKPVGVEVLDRQIAGLRAGSEKDPGPQAATGKDELRVVRWTEDKHRAADAKEIVAYLLETNAQLIGGGGGGGGGGVVGGGIATTMFSVLLQILAPLSLSTA